ncbi:hypothetical protein BC827DRAFT_1241566 [Russula dissimulans]|nr:hypothetical protein BC827DRAFT_1241566 [Russula dissimulans]
MPPEGHLAARSMNRMLWFFHSALLDSLTCLTVTWTLASKLPSLVLPSHFVASNSVGSLLWYMVRARKSPGKITFYIDECATQLECRPHRNNGFSNNLAVSSLLHSQGHIGHDLQSARDTNTLSM